MRTMTKYLAAVAAMLFLSACETTPQAPRQVSPVASTPQPVQPPEPVKPIDPVAQKEQALTEALGIYAEGRYDDAVVWLTPLVGAPELSLSAHVRIQKFMAFSHCAMNRLRQCRQHFDTALELDPTFQLTEAERGHPVWGREFINARNAARNKRPPVRRP
ncbi:MAG: TssQ family T6SS-associated lipoprotein [Rhizobacter sp.]